MRRLNLIAVLAVFFIGGCTYNSKPLGKPLPMLTYENLTPYLIHGGAVRIQQSFKSSEQSKRLAEQFPVAPDVLLKRYAHKRFVTAGAPEQLIFDIKDASLTQVSDDENIVGFLSGAAEDYYKLNVSIAMTPIRADGQRAAPFTIKMKRELYVPQNASLAQRDFREFEMLEKAVQMIDAEISNMVQNKMTANYF